MNPWTFYDFLGLAGDNEIRAWLNSLPERASAKIDARIFYLRAILVWPPAYVSALKGWPDLRELRVVCDGNQYRPIGFYGPGRGEFTLLIGAIEKGKLPRRVLETANANRETVLLSDRRRIIEHVFHQRAVGK